MYPESIDNDQISVENVPGELGGKNLNEHALQDPDIDLSLLGS